MRSLHCHGTFRVGHAQSGGKKGGDDATKRQPELENDNTEKKKARLISPQRPVAVYVPPDSDFDEDEMEDDEDVEMFEDEPDPGWGRPYYGPESSDLERDSEDENPYGDEDECEYEEEETATREEGYPEGLARYTKVCEGDSRLENVCLTAAIIIKVYGQVRQFPEVLASFLEVWTSDQHFTLTPVRDNCYFQQAFTEVIHCCISGVDHHL